MKNIEELKKIKNALEVLINESENTKFEVGKWYKLTEDYSGTLKKGEVYQMINFQTDSKSCIILDHVAFGIEGRNYLAPYKDMLIEATPKEVEEALIKEAEKRGLKEGTIINNSMLNDCSNTSCKAENNEYKFIEDELYSNCLLLDGFVIFLNGKWAEIVKTKTIDEIARDLSALSEYGIINYMSSTENKQTIIETLNNL